MKKKIFIAISGIILLVVAVFVIGGFQHLRIELISDTVKIELGETLNTNVSFYAKGNIIDAKLNLSNVNIQKAGVYDANISTEKKSIDFQVVVTDTTPPTGNKVEGLTFSTKEEVNANNLVTDLKDISNIIVTFSDGEEIHIYSDDGVKKETIKLTDESYNQTKVDVDFQIIADSTKPVIKGITDFTVYAGEYIDFLDGVKVTDDRDGDLTELILVNTDGLILDEPGEYTIIYSVSDISGNEATKKSQITVLKDKSPVLQGIADKVVNLNDKIDYMYGVTAKDDRDGNLTTKIEVDSSKVDIKSVGDYKVIYSVTDSAGNTAEKSILVTVKKKENFAPENKTSTKKSKSKSTQQSDENSSGGFEFFDVPPSGPDVDGHIDPGGGPVGTWG